MFSHFTHHHTDKLPKKYVFLQKSFSLFFRVFLWKSVKYKLAGFIVLEE